MRSAALVLCSVILTVSRPYTASAWNADCAKLLSSRSLPRIDADAEQARWGHHASVLLVSAACPALRGGSSPRSLRGLRA